MTNPISTASQEPTTPTTAKRLKRHHHEENFNHHSLLPGLPDHISQISLSLLPPSTLYSVCRSWRNLIYSPSFPPFLSLYALLTPTHPQISTSLQLSSFDPISREWHLLPPPPPPLRFLFRHPSFISRKLPIQSVTVSGNLVLLAATDDQFLPALPHPLVFVPSVEKWIHGPPLSAPRRWCAAGAHGGSVYVASGIGSHYSSDVARSVGKWDMDTNAFTERRVSSIGNREDHHGLRKDLTDVRCRWAWREMGKMKDVKFSREAIEAVGWRGRLCMVNVKGEAAKEGAIYDVERDTWAEMPEGMLGGWRGPAAAMEEETIYVVDESKGTLRRYDHVRDTWVEVMESGLLRGAQQVAAARGKVCVLCGDGCNVAVVDVAEGRVWVVDAPPGLQVVAVHILPRLSH